MRELDFTRPEKSKQERMKEYNKKYREEHSTMVQCKCGGRFKEISKYTHYKTARHQDFLDSKINGGGTECGGNLEPPT
jgi:hypothetical protein